MKCPKCGGSGFDVVHGFDCISCDGKGEIEVTNEEWFCGLSTEEKADLMSRIVGCSNCPIPKDGRSCMGTYSGCWHEIIKWLKQPHKE